MIVLELNKPIKMYWIKCNKYRKSVDSIFLIYIVITLVLSIMCSKWVDKNDIIFRVEKSIEVLKIIGLNE